MPPARSRTLDDKPDGISQREKYNAAVAPNGRSKKSNNAAHAGKDGSGTMVNGAASDGGHGNTTALNWAKTPASLLHKYRHAYALQTPAAFHRNITEATLTNPNGIGLQSPTMVKRRRQQKKISRDQLALAVRKHFNDLAVNETDVIIEFLYTVQGEDKALRQRFGPSKPK